MTKTAMISLQIKIWSWVS